MLKILYSGIGTKAIGYLYNFYSTSIKKEPPSVVTAVEIVLNSKKGTGMLKPIEELLGKFAHDIAFVTGNIITYAIVGFFQSTKNY